MQDTNELLPWTGERMVTQLIEHEGAIDHLHRYARAKDLGVGLDVLDIASGEGYGSALLAQVAKSVIGVDISHEAVQFAQQKYKSNNLSFRQGSAAEIPVEDKSIDLVVSFETLEHHDQHEKMFSEIKRILRPNGVLIMSSPEKSTYQELDPNNPFHIRELTLDEFKELVGGYFSNYQMLHQRYLEASILTVEGASEGLIEYNGDFENIESTRGLKKWYYNICIASNGPLQSVVPSIFRRHDAPASPWVKEHELQERVKQSVYKEEQLNEQINLLYSSYSYRIGRLLTAPIRILKRKL